MPTFVEVAGADYPSQFAGHEVTPMQGRSLVPTFDSEESSTPTVLGARGEPSGTRRRLEASRLAQQDWELYHIANDRAEQHDLSQQQPEKALELKRLWDRWANEVGVLTPQQFDERRTELRQRAAQERRKKKRTDPAALRITASAGPGATRTWQDSFRSLTAFIPKSFFLTATPRPPSPGQARQKSVPKPRNGRDSRRECI